MRAESNWMDRLSVGSSDDEDIEELARSFSMPAVTEGGESDVTTGLTRAFSEHTLRWEGGALLLLLLNLPLLGHKHGVVRACVV
jgi:hypothetical protein